MQPSITYTFSNVGNLVGEHTHTFRTGWNVLEGDNALGKTNLMDALVCATSGAGRLNAHVARLPDGTAKTLPAYVAEEGKGVLIRSARQKGELVVASVPIAPLDLLTSFLTGNGVKDPGLADEARIRALFALIPEAGTATEGDVQTLSCGKLAGTNLAGQPVLTVKEALKTEANALALSAERKSAELAGAAKVHRATIAAAVAPEVGEELVMYLGEDCTALEAIARAAAAVAAEKKLQASRRAKLEDVKRTLGERPKPESLDAGISEQANLVTTVAAVLERKEAAAGKVREQIAKLQADLAKASQDVEGQRGSLRVEQASLATMQANRARVEVEAGRWDVTQAQFKEIVDLPTDEQAEQAKEEADRASLHLSRARAAQGASEAVRAHDERVAVVKVLEAAATKDAEASVQSGKEYRKVAEDVEGQLGVVLGRKGIPAGLTVDGGRLYATVDGETKLFADPVKPSLSEGQQTRVMLDVGIQAFPGRVMAVEAAWLTSLAPRRVEEFAAMAKERGIILVSARPTDEKEISVRYYPSEPA